ncbi:hypothetical protein LDENG_00148580 [Lucifuga dentata]|nr:hypothetical protein LDENG_00148580 [Lucifuga dentata]
MLKYGHLHSHFFTWQTLLIHICNVLCIFSKPWNPIDSVHICLICLTCIIALLDYRQSAHVRCFGDKVREARLRWFGHVQRRDSEHIGRRMLRLELPGRRPRGRPKRRFMDVVKEDMKLVGVREEEAEDRVRWRQMIRCGDP